MKDSEGFKVEILEIIENPDGTSTIDLELSDEFVDFFVKHEGLREWDNEYFQTWFVDQLWKLCDPDDTVCMDID